MLKRKAIPDLAALKRLKVAELKELCSEHALRKSGNKADLITLLDMSRGAVNATAKQGTQQLIKPVMEVKTSPSAQRSAVPTPTQQKKTPAAALFEKYATTENPREMDLSGFVQFGMDLAGGDEAKSVSPEHTALLFVLCWKFKAKSFGNMGIEGFVAGCEAIKCSTIEEIASRSGALLAEVSSSSKHVDPSRRSAADDRFQTLHSYVYDILRPDGKKYIEKDMACLALQAIFQGLAGRESPHITLFVKFLQSRDKILSLNSDQWKGFLQFSNEVASSFDGYSDADPWPSLLDDFVGWAKEQEEWTASHPPKA
jgi:hypothetical protein